MQTSSYTAPASSIRLRLAGQIQNLTTSSHELTLGGGGVAMQLDAGGSILLEAGPSGGFEQDEESDIDEDFGSFVDLSAQISRQVEAQMQAVTRQINEQLASLTASLNQVGFSEEQRQRILEQARRSSERAAERAARASPPRPRKAGAQTGGCPASQRNEGPPCRTAQSALF